MNISEAFKPKPRTNSVECNGADLLSVLSGLREKGFIPDRLETGVHGNAGYRVSYFNRRVEELETHREKASPDALAPDVIAASEQAARSTAGSNPAAPAIFSEFNVGHGVNSGIIPICLKEISKTSRETAPIAGKNLKPLLDKSDQATEEEQCAQEVVAESTPINFTRNLEAKIQTSKGRSLSQITNTSLTGDEGIQKRRTHMMFSKQLSGLERLPNETAKYATTQNLKPTTMITQSRSKSDGFAEITTQKYQSKKDAILCVNANLLHQAKIPANDIALVAVKSEVAPRDPLQKWVVNPSSKPSHRKGTLPRGAETVGAEDSIESRMAKLQEKLVASGKLKPTKTARMPYAD